MGTEFIVAFLIYLAILVVVFLLLRQVMCWYWKINQHLVNQEEQIKIQKETNDLLIKLIKGNQHTTFLNDSIIVDSSENDQDSSIKLSQEEIEKLNSKIEILGVNEIIVIHPKSRIIKKIHKSEYDESKGWIILKEYEK